MLIIYYRQAWVNCPGFQSSDNRPCTRVSIIIPARNEAKYIGACLGSILKNNYPKDQLEILVIDDHSTDDTAQLILSFADRNVRLISLKDHVNGELNAYKKKAIEVAIAQATGQLIITTDADCIAPQNWLGTIVSFYEKNDAAFIAAPVAINCSNRFIEIFQALDFMTLQGITGGAVHKKIHTMCNGANLAYTKAAFHEVNGFAGIDTIASGDDMLLMHKIYQRHPEKTLYLKSKSAIVQTAPVHSINEFFNQRIRWASKADKYDDKRMLPVLLIVYLFNLTLLLLPVIAVFNPAFSILNVHFSIFLFWALLLFLKMLIELIFLFPVAVFFNKQKLLWWFPIMQPFHIIYTVIAGFLGTFGSYKWKERKVK